MSTTTNPTAAALATDAPKRFPYPISPEYVKNWTAERAIAEFVANAIDEDPEGFSVEWSDGMLTITNGGRGFGYEGLIMGLTSKGSESIGTFGEGAKLGCLVLARHQRIGRVAIDTVGARFEPVIVDADHLDMLPSRNGAGAETPKVLAFDFYASERTEGTCVTIECAKDLADKVCARFLHIAEGSYEAPQGDGRIISRGESGRIYVGGVFVSKLDNALFSYDFSLAHKSMQNRDRTVLDHSTLRHLIGSLVTRSEDSAIITALAAAATREYAEGEKMPVEIENLRLFGLDPSHRRAWAEARNELFAENELVCWLDPAGTEQALDLEDRGYKILRPSGTHWTFRSIMEALGIPAASVEGKTRSQTAKRPEVTKWVKKLTASEQKTLDDAVTAVRAVYGASAVDKVKVYSDTRFEGADTALAFGGYYQPQSGLIALHRDNLASMKDTMDVLVHEAAHRIGHRVERKWDYQDRTRGFESTLGDMAAKAVRLLMENGLLDQLSAEEVETLNTGVDPRLVEHPAVRAREIVKQAMKDKSYTAKGLIKVSHCTQATVNKLRAGQRLTNPAQAQAACAALDLDWGAIALALITTSLAKDEVNAQVCAYGRWAASRSKAGVVTSQVRTIGVEAIKHLRATQSDADVLAAVDEIDRQLHQHIADKQIADRSWLAPYGVLIERVLSA